MKRNCVHNGVIGELTKQLSERELKVMLHEVIAHFPHSGAGAFAGGMRADLNKVKIPTERISGLGSL